jgi:hypothetical protein
MTAADLAARRATAPERIDNGTLPAGSQMFYYCQSCGHLVAVLPEDWWRDEDAPPKQCDWCLGHGIELG